MRKKLFKNKFFQFGLFLLVLYFTFILRAHNYDKVPGMGHLEELAFGWAGINLVETGVPVSWSTLDYPDRAEVFRGKIKYQGGDPVASVRLYKPWLDQPPLFSILIGEFAHLYGANRNEILPTSYIRMPVVLISIITSITIFLIARLVSGYWLGIGAMLVYGLTPIMVLASRMAVPENLIAAIYMVVLYLLLKFQQKPRFLYLIGLPILIGISGLSKATGFFILPLVLFFSFSNKYYKSCLYLILATLPFIAFYFWYGIHFDSQIFWRLNEIQSSRPAGFNSLAWFFATPAYDINSMVDSWFIFCLLSAGFFLFLPKNGLAKYILLAFVYWVIIVMISGGENDLLPWYRFPSYPLLAIIGAWGVSLLYEKPDFFRSFLAVGLLLGNRRFLVNAFRQNTHAQDFRLIFSALMAPSLLGLIYNQKWLDNLSRFVIILAIIVGAFMNAKYIYNAFEIACENQSCAFGPVTFLSGLHYPVFWRLLVLH